MSNNRISRRRNRHFGMEALETRKLAATIGFAQVDTGADQPEMAEATAEVSTIRAGIDATFKIDGNAGGGQPQCCLPQSGHHHQHDNVLPGDGSTGTLEPSSVDAAMQSNDWYNVLD